MNSDRKLLPVDLSGAPINLQDSLQYFAAYVLLESELLDFGHLMVNFNSPKMNISSRIKHANRNYESSSNDWQVVINKSERPLALTNDGSTIEFYLKCIPNTGPGQDWSIYFALVQREGQLLERGDESFELFKCWASQSSKFIENDAVNFGII